MPCLTRDVTVMPTSAVTADDPQSKPGLANGTNNNKLQQQDKEIAPPSNTPMTKPLASADVFVDNFIQLGQGGPQRMHAIRQHLWHAVDRVLAQPSETSAKQPEAMSLKKLQKSDGS